jgi:hypothetical protein
LTANPTNGWYARFLREVFLATAQMAPRHDRTSVRHSDAKIHRIRSGVSLELICERTKISRHFLEAIEERAYQRLPGGIFDISYIRQYAEQIGYSAEGGGGGGGGGPPTPVRSQVTTRRYKRKLTHYLKTCLARSLVESTMSKT